MSQHKKKLHLKNPHSFFLPSFMYATFTVLALIIGSVGITATPHAAATSVSATSSASSVVSSSPAHSSNIIATPLVSLAQPFGPSLDTVMPDVPFTEFQAPLCGNEAYYTSAVSGNLVKNPRSAENDHGYVQDLTFMSGDRLASFNAGNVVPIYDVYGSNYEQPYPPVCGTRFVEGIGAVSEWMFCTDYTSWVCSRTDGLGTAIGDYPLGPAGLETELELGDMHELDDRNPKLDEEQERLIAYLAQHGDIPVTTVAGNEFSYPDVTLATFKAGVNEMITLQLLIWCISDPITQEYLDELATTNPGLVDSETKRGAFCETNMDQDRQAEILLKIPSTPLLSLELSSSGIIHTPGDTATFTLTTNVFNHPFDVTSLNLAGDLAFNNAIYDPVTGLLTVPGPSDDSTTSVTIEGTFTASTVGTLELNVSTVAGSVESIFWNQTENPHVGEIAGTRPCQVFATFRDAHAQVLESGMNIIFEEFSDGPADGPADGLADGPEDGTTDTGVDGSDDTDTSDTDDISDASDATADLSDELADSGIGDSPVPFIALGGALLLLGIIAVIVARRKRS